VTAGGDAQVIEGDVQETGGGVRVPEGVVPDTAGLVRRARSEAGLTQHTLAERAGVVRSTVAQVESGARTPSLATLANLLAAAGQQMRVDLEPLDSDVLRAIETVRAQPDVASGVVDLWAGFRAMDEVAYRIEGLAAAALLGAPVPVPTVTIALADTAVTHAWLASQLHRRQLTVRVDGWYSRLDFDLEGDERDGAAVRERLAAECSDGRFWIEGWLDVLAARLAPFEEVARRVLVETREGTIAVQPLDEIESGDADVQRVLRVMRRGRAGPT
jgi:transcriptional regulator with XRE-family HTH domain